MENVVEKAKYMKRYRAAHRAEIVEYQAAYRVAHRVDKAKYDQCWQAANPEAHAAHLAVKRAIWQGVLVPQPCQVCGAKAQAHHEDYSKPLEVWWLCPLHHKARHAELRYIERLAA